MNGCSQSAFCLADGIVSSRKIQDGAVGLSKLSPGFLEDINDFIADDSLPDATVKSSPSWFEVVSWDLAMENISQAQFGAFDRLPLFPLAASPFTPSFADPTTPTGVAFITAAGKPALELQPGNWKVTVNLNLTVEASGTPSPAYTNYRIGLAITTNLSAPEVFGPGVPTAHFSDGPYSSPGSVIYAVNLHRIEFFSVPDATTQVVRPEIIYIIDTANGGPITQLAGSTIEVVPVLGTLV